MKDAFRYRSLNNLQGVFWNMICKKTKLLGLEIARDYLVGIKT